MLHKLLKSHKFTRYYSNIFFNYLNFILYLNPQPSIKILVNYIFFKTWKYIISYTNIYNHNKCLMVKYIVPCTIETMQIQ